MIRFNWRKDHDTAHAGKVLLKHDKTGEEFERWPVDAREMMATGEYTQVMGHADPVIRPRNDEAEFHKGSGSDDSTPPSDTAVVGDEDSGPDPVPHKTAAEKALEADPHKIMADAAEAEEEAEEEEEKPAPKKKATPKKKTPARKKRTSSTKKK